MQLQSRLQVFNYCLCNLSYLECSNCESSIAVFNCKECGYFLCPDCDLILHKKKYHVRTPIYEVASPYQAPKKNPMQWTRLHILIFGEVGAGKSTLINTLYLWSLDKPLKECKELAIPISGEFDHFPVAEIFKKKASESFSQGGAKTSQSQTNIVYYDFKIKKNEEEGYHVVVMDTPMFANIRGIVQDSFNIKELLNAITKLPDINGIICMANGYQARSAHMLAIISNLTAIFPKGFATNLKILYSNVPFSSEPNNIFHLELAERINKTLAPPSRYDNDIFKRDFTKLPPRPPRPLRSIYYYEDAEESFCQIKEYLCEVFDELASVPPVKAISELN